MISKAELHVHLEGTITPEMITRLAKRNHLAIPKTIFGENKTLCWRDFNDFIKIYEIASSVIRTPEDYRDLTYDYLAKIAAQGAIYVELTSSPDHYAGMEENSYWDHLRGIAAGIDLAQKQFGITARIIVTCVRHLGVDRCMQIAEQVIAQPHPYVVGFGMAGDEINYSAKEFASVFRKVAAAGISCTVHAGEFLGPESIWEALDYLPVKRIGHGVRAIEDPLLMKTLAERQIALELCPGSNMALKIFQNYQYHPLRKFFDAGIPISLNSDDPPFFNTSLGAEYTTAQEKFGFSKSELLQITTMAIQHSFAKSKIKKSLLEKINREQKRL